jgi:hypothetical protein
MYVLSLALGLSIHSKHHIHLALSIHNKLIGLPLSGNRTCAPFNLETDRFFAASGVQLVQSDRGQFHYRRAAFSSQLKSKVGNNLTKVAVLRVNLNIDGASIPSRSHTHPSHSETSRLLTSSFPLGAPVPHATQCM